MYLPFGRCKGKHSAVILPQRSEKGLKKTLEFQNVERPFLSISAGFLISLLQERLGGQKKGARRLPFSEKKEFCSKINLRLCC